MKRFESLSPTAARTICSVSLLCVAAILLSACQALVPRKSVTVLDEAGVRRLFVGNTVESYNLNTSFTSFTYYHPNGQAIQERLWTRRLGKWSIRKNGEICLAFGKRKLKCRHIVSKGDRHYKVLPDKSGGQRKIVRYRYFVKGNALSRRSP